MLTCSRCERTYPVSEPRWRCECGAYLRLQHKRMFALADLVGRPATLWRYREALGIDDQDATVSLGEGMTPCIPGALDGCDALFKLDYLCPTGSYKDRGSTVMISKLKAWGIHELVEDSSGNAGASVAAYAAAAGMRANIYIPAATSPGKAAQIAMYGANLIRVPGSREATTSAALAAAEKTFYASHNWNPWFVAGLKTLAYEIAEQLGWRAPDWVVTPVGGGSLILGLHLGFADLLRAGIVSSAPRLAAVQAAACAPVYQAWKTQLADVPAVEKGETVAEGISIAQPVKGRDILQAIRASHGVVETVTDEEILAAVLGLGRRGIYVEPTGGASAAALPGLYRKGIVKAGEQVVVVLTGFGLKATDKMEALCKKQSLPTTLPSPADFTRKQ